MLVRIFPWDSESDPNTFKNVALYHRSAILSSSLVKKFDLQVETNFILNWPHGLYRSLITCNVDFNEEFFSQKCSIPHNECVENETLISKKKTPTTEQKHNVHQDNMCSSFCTNCVSNVSDLSLSDAVGVPKVVYFNVINKIYKEPQHVKETWGLIHCVSELPIIAESISLRILDVKENLSSCKQNKTSLASVDCIQHRVQLWETFDFINTPSMSLLLQDLLVGKLIFQNEEIYILLMNTTVKFRVECIQPFSAGKTQFEHCEKCSTQYPTPVRIMPQSTLTIKCPLHDGINISVRPSLPGRYVGLARLGGCSAIKKQITDMLIIPLVCPNLLTNLGISLPKGILLYGPPGTGKTYIIKAVIEEMELRWDELREEYKFFNPDAKLPPILEIFKPIDQSENPEMAVKELFQKIRSWNQNCEVKRSTILFIDEIDTVCPNRESSDQSDRRIVATFLTELDGLQKSSDIVLIAATNRPNALDPAFRRAGRIDTEIEVDVPTAEERIEILVVLLEKINTTMSLSFEDIRSVALDCHAFVAADLNSLCTTAGIHAIREGILKKTIPKINISHLRSALKIIKPSAMKEVAIEIPHVSWNDIGGYDAVKEKLKESVEWPLLYRELFLSLRIQPPRGILLYGPPGCSKTLLAKAVATESNMNFISVKGPELFSKWVGESERAVREIFRKARQNAPCIIFFDEIDALGGDRQASGGGSGVEARVLSQMLNEMDGIQPIKQVIIIGATNRPDLLDAALLRPGRLDRLVYVPLPDISSRVAICTVHLPECCSQKKAWSLRLSEATDGYTGAEIAMVCREASMLALREYLESEKKMNSNSEKETDNVPYTVILQWAHLEKALQLVQPRISSTLINFYKDYNKSLNL